MEVPCCWLLMQRCWLAGSCWPRCGVAALSQSWFHVEPGGSQEGEGAVAVVKMARKAPTVT